MVKVVPSCKFNLSVKGRHVHLFNQIMCYNNAVYRMQLKGSEKQQFGLCQGSARSGTSVLSIRMMLTERVCIYYVIQYHNYYNNNIIIILL